MERDCSEACCCGLGLYKDSAKKRIRNRSIPLDSTHANGAHRKVGAWLGLLASSQERIPASKAEIWAPYKQAINEIGDRPVKGPDGMTTVRALESERKQLSAINRGLKTGNPVSMQLAQQRGLDQASALERERAVTAALDPELQKVGIKPGEIRKAFG